MQSDVPLDYALFQLSPRRSRCELLVSYDGTMEKLASGLVKPFVTHLKVAEEQVASAGKSIKLDVERVNNAETWFTKGTLERFVRFVSTPEVLEMVNTFDAEMSQLEAARKIYSQGTADDEFSASGGVRNGGAAASDATKKELLRAIDVRLSAVKQDLMTACSRAWAAGFNPETVAGLQFFADHFGAHRLSEACSKFIANTPRLAEVFNFDNIATSKWKPPSDNILRSSTGSDMSIDDPFDDQPKLATCTTGKVTVPSRRFSREPSPNPINDVEERETNKVKNIDKDQALGGSTTTPTTSTTESASTSTGKPQLTRRLSVQERINLFENKAQTSPSTATTPTSSTSVKPDLRRLSSDVNLSADKAVLRRWSGASDMSIDVSGERKEPDSNANTPTPSSASSSRTLFPPKSKDLRDPKLEGGENSKLPVSSESNSKIPSFSGKSSDKDQSTAGFQSRVTSFGRTEEFDFENQSTPCQPQVKSQTSNTVQFGSLNQSGKEEKLKGLSGGGDKPEEEYGKGSGTSTETERSLVRNQGETSYDVKRDQQVRKSQFSGFQKRTLEGDLDSVPVQPRWNSLAEVEKAEGKDFESLVNQTESQTMPMETYGVFRGNLKGNGSGSDQVTKHGGRKESGSKVSGGHMGYNGKSIIENQEDFSLVPEDQGQRVRQPKGNQGVNDELQMKANELEKLFAEHKLRLPGDQSNSARRVGTAEVAKEVEGYPVIEKQEIEASTPPSKTVANHDNNVTPKHNMHCLSFSDDSRGKLYQKYMHKRDAKLREDWSSNRPEKEAQMKALQDSLEKSRAEMKAKLADSAEKRNSNHVTQRRAKNPRSFQVRSTMKRDQLTDTFMSDEDEGQATKSAQNKRVQPNKNASSPAIRNSAASTPRSSGKASNSTTGRRRLPYDSPLAQSVPNFSDLRKENTKPSSAGSKSVRPQGRTHARKKSTAEDLLLGNEEKSRRSQSLRKNTGTMELNNSHNSDDRIIGTEEMVNVTINEEHDYETTVVEESTYIDNNQGRLSHESDKSANSGYENHNTLRFVSQAGLVSAAELPNSVPSFFPSMGSALDSPGESPGYWNSHLQNAFAFSHETSDIDASDSPTGSPASWNFHTLSQSEAEAAKMRKKWGLSQKPTVGIDSLTQSRKDVTRGLKRFLKFGRKNRASDSLVDWISATTSEGDDSEDGRDFINRTSEDLRKSRMGFSQSHNSDEGFHESELLSEQVQALHSSIPAPPSNFKLREEVSGNSLKTPKSFFSLSNFRSKANESKPR